MRKRICIAAMLLSFAVGAAPVMALALPESPWEIFFERIRETAASEKTDPASSEEPETQSILEVTVESEPDGTLEVTAAPEGNAGELPEETEAGSIWGILLGKIRRAQEAVPSGTEPESVPESTVPTPESVPESFGPAPESVPESTVPTPESVPESFGPAPESVPEKPEPEPDSTPEPPAQPISADTAADLGGASGPQPVMAEDEAAFNGTWKAVTLKISDMTLAVDDNMMSISALTQAFNMKDTKIRINDGYVDLFGNYSPEKYTLADGKLQFGYGQFSSSEILNRVLTLMDDGTMTFTSFGMTFTCEKESGTADTEPGPESVEPGPESVEPGPESTEPGPESVEPGPESIEPGPENGAPAIKTDVLYECVSITVGDFTADPASLGGSCRLRLNSDGTVDFTVADEDLMELTWHEEGEGAVIDYYEGQQIPVTPAENGLVADYLGEMLMLFEETAA